MKTSLSTMMSTIKLLKLVVFFAIACGLLYYILCRSSIVLVSPFEVSKNFASKGRFGPSIIIPIVAVAVAVIPTSGRVLMWSSDKPDSFGHSNSTATVIYDHIAGDIKAYNITATNHNMFCPDLSLDMAGRPVVTGGSTSSHTSIYDAEQEMWLAGPELQIGRGYHAQVTISDGRIFTIGGSWSGSLGGKYGEAFDPLINMWVGLPDCKAEPILTHDTLGVFASDNHAWLFAWKGGSVFHAGPSSAMNWYGTDGNGSHVPSTLRGHDTDAMNGNAVMYDAVNGKILTLGGATHYSQAYSTLFISPARQPCPA
jgi:galactose oxidase